MERGDADRQRGEAQAAKANGYTVAYIVGFKDGVRMSVEQLKAFE